MYSDVELNTKYDTSDKTKDVMALEYPFCTVNIILTHVVVLHYNSYKYSYCLVHAHAEQCGMRLYV